MARKSNGEKLKSIYNKVEENPGKRAGFIARLLGISRSEVTRALPALEEKTVFIGRREGWALAVPDEVTVTWNH